MQFLLSSDQQLIMEEDENEQELRIDLKINFQSSDNGNQKKLLVRQDITPNRLGADKFSVVEVMGDQSLTLQSPNDRESQGQIMQNETFQNATSMLLNHQLGNFSPEKLRQLYKRTQTIQSPVQRNQQDTLQIFNKDISQHSQLDPRQTGNLVDDTQSQESFEFKGPPQPQIGIEKRIIKVSKVNHLKPPKQVQQAQHNNLIITINSPKNYDSSRNLYDSGGIQMDESKKFISSQVSIMGNEKQFKRCYSDMTERVQAQNQGNRIFVALGDLKKKISQINRSYRNSGQEEVMTQKNINQTDNPTFQPAFLKQGIDKIYQQGIGGGNFYASTNDLLRNKTTLNKKLSSKQQQYMSKKEKAKQRWSKLYNVLRTISLLQRHKTKIINDPEDILTEINNFPTKPNTVRSKSHRSFHTDFEDKLRSEKFFKYISIGGSEVIQKIEKMIIEDPKKHMYNIDSQHYILNRKNAQKQTPLYVASKHGHLDVVQFLLEQGANPHIQSHVSSTESESVLEVSVRWSHIQIVNFLLQSIRWSKIDIKCAYRHIVFEEESNAFKKMLKEYSRLHFGKIYSFFTFSSRCACCLPTTKIQAHKI
eukprot:403355666